MQNLSREKLMIDTMTMLDDVAFAKAMLEKRRSAGRILCSPFGTCSG